MTALTILGSVAAIVVAVITIWNTTTVSAQRRRIHGAIRSRRECIELAKRTDRFAAEPALIEFEVRFDELADAYESKQVPHDLRVLWAQVFQLARESPLGPPFRYRALEVHRDMNAMTVRKGVASVTGREWLEVCPIPLAPRSAIHSPSAPIPAIKD